MIAIVLILLFFPVMLFRPKLGLCVLVFLLAFLPRYIGVGLGEEGFALTPRRLIVLAAFLAILAVWLIQPRSLNQLAAIVAANRLIVSIALSAFAVKLIATLVGSGIGVNLFYVIDDMLLSIVPAVAALAYIRTAKDERHLISALVLALAISAVLAVIESAKGSVLLQGIVAVSVEEAGRGGLTDLVRDGRYRAKALFDNPLLLAEFTCICWPWAVYLFITARNYLQRWLGMAAMLLSPVAIFAAHTRSGWLIFCFGAVTLLALRTWDRSGPLARIPLTVVIASAIGTVALAATLLVSKIGELVATGVAGSRSIAERLEQYVAVATALRDSPILGFGMTRNFATDLDFLNNFDNYWLRLLLEGGMLLILVFLVLIIRTVADLLSGRAKAPSLEYRWFMSIALVSVLSFAFYKLFISMPTNNTYFFLILALILRRKYWLKRLSENANLTVPQ